MTIKAEEIPMLETQSVRVLLRNELGHIVHDMTLPLVVGVRDADGNVNFSRFDVDAEINKYVNMHEERYRVFIAAAQERGHVAADAPIVQAPTQGDCGCS